MGGGISREHVGKYLGRGAVELTCPRQLPQFQYFFSRVLCALMAIWRAHTPCSDAPKYHIKLWVYAMSVYIYIYPENIPMGS